MDEHTEHWLRSLTARQTAQQFLIDNILGRLLLKIPKPERLAWSESLLDLAEQTEQFSGLAADDVQAERLADMVVQSQRMIDEAIGRALGAVERAEGGR
jgi:hypothetical protein